MPKGMGVPETVIIALILIVLIVYLASRSVTYAIVAGAIFMMALYILLHKFDIL